MEKLIEKNKDIKDMIYEIRGKQVMLDSDLAKLYGCKNGTKEINQAVKNNIDKFPERFAFHITESEYNGLKSIFLTSKTRGGSRKGHTAFTEQGVAMLATILKSPIATKVSIQIMDAFVAMRKFINSNLLEQKYVNDLVLKHDKEIKFLKETFDNFQNTPNHHLFFEGQVYDAYNLMIEILVNAKKEIIIIDNYAGRELFNLLKNINVSIKIYTKNIDEEAKKKYQKQYNNINIIKESTFHDRFIIIDNKILYHCGASFKELGKKCFAINKIEDISILKGILKVLKKDY